MDSETSLSVLLMFVGLGFFLTVVIVVLRDHREAQNRLDRREETRYERKLSEAREFGYEGSKLKE